MAKLTNMKPRLQAMRTRVKPPPKTADRFYVSPEWRTLLRMIKIKRGNYCERCGADGRKERMIGDHIQEIKDGGEPLDENNIQLLCHKKCHPRKTAMARQARAAGEALKRSASNRGQ